MLETKKYQTVLIKTIRQAGQKLLRDYETLDESRVFLKTKRDLVTTADMASEKIIINNLKKYFPTHQILSEESGWEANESDFLWIIDPLDGTTNFYIHNPLWSVSIALVHRGKIIMGAIYAPLTKELFFAEKGRGAYLNNKRIYVRSDAQKNVNAFCHGSEAKNIKKAMKYYVYQKSHSFDCRQLGSAAIEMAYVASGRIASLLIPGTKPWDVAAGALLVQEAGGRVSDFKNKQWQIFEPDILAANKREHSLIIKTIEKIKI